MTPHLKKTRTLALTLMAGIAAISVSPISGRADEPAEKGSVWWNELISTNPERVRDFYASVMGWTPKVVAAEDNSRPPAVGETEYTLFMNNGAETAGVTKYEGKDPNDPKPGWLMYVQVANVDDVVVNAMKNGGKVLKAPYNVDKVGRLAVIQDPDGNAVGIYNPVAPPAGQ